MKLSFALLPVAAVAVADADVRRLEYAVVGGYTPTSQVTDHCAIDLDQAAMEVQLALKTPDAWAKARDIYKNGGHSKSYAEVTITPGLTKEVPKGTQLVGKTSDGTEVSGKAKDMYSAGVNKIKFQYKTSDDQANYVNCQVGALVSTNLVGCLAASGEITIDGVAHNYTYTPAEDNNNGRTIAGFSTAAQGKMYEGCLGCPYTDFKYFYEYYGTFDYAHQMVEHAFDAKMTEFTNGNNDFSLYENEGNEQIIKKGTAYMNVFMYVIREWEDALDDCQLGVPLGNEDPVKAWDEAVCFYTGSLEGVDGEASGKLLHQLADKRCANYKTCGENSGKTDTMAKINHDIFKMIGMGQLELQRGECGAARKTVKEIISKMYVPMIQGAMRYAYKVGALNGGEKEAAEGAIFAAAVLPRVHAASPEAAKIIHDNLQVSANPDPDYAAVKTAFESVYEDIGITCKDVGGLWFGAENRYYNGMEPCGLEAGATTTAPDEDESSDGSLRSKSVAALSAAAALTMFAL